jgi:hypothetical protein
VSNSPQHLPFCEYPSAKDSELHGLQLLPDKLPIVDLQAVQEFRSNRYPAVGAKTLEPSQILQMTREVAESFTMRDQLTRHLNPPKYPPDGLNSVEHTDGYGTDKFGPWTRSNIFYWFIRLFVLTDATSPSTAIETRQDILEHSLAILDNGGQVIAGAFRDTKSPPDERRELRENDIFLTAVLPFMRPILRFLGIQEYAAMLALTDQYPTFRDAYHQSKIGSAALVARTDALPKEDTFELTVATVEHFQSSGYHYLVTEAVNQWTGAAFEALNGVRVHFQPFQAEKVLPESNEPVEGKVTSPNGFISYKDSGSMFYVVRLK